MLPPVLAAQAAEEHFARELIAELGLPEDAIIADVGAGDGMVATGFVRALPKGHVFFQDIQDHHLKTWESKVRPWAERASFVIGTVTDPKLPEKAIDLVVLRDALHEFTQADQMLARIRESLAPGGQLVVIDRYQGPVRARIPFAERGDEHAFNGEVTTARLGFDAGLVYVGNARNLLGFDHKQGYGMIFTRPEDPAVWFAPLDVEAAKLDLPKAGRIAVAAHDPSRQAVIAYLEQTLPPAVEVIELDLDEWRYPGTPTSAPDTDLSWTMLRTFGGVPERQLPELDAVLFVDAFHALYYEDVLLGVLHQALKGDAPLIVIDRKEANRLPRLEYHHRRGVPEEDVLVAIHRAGLEQASRLSLSGSFAIHCVKTTRPPSLGLSDVAWRSLLTNIEGCDRVRVLGDDPTLSSELLAELGLELEVHSTRYGWESGFPTEIENAARYPYPYLPGKNGALEGCLVIVPDYELLPDARVMSTGKNTTLILVMPKEGRRDGILDEVKELEAARPYQTLTVIDGESLGHPDRVVFRFDEPK